MSWFKCKCGESFKDNDNDMAPTGIMLRLSVLQSIEEEISVLLDEYMRVSEDERYNWAFKQLGVSYSPEQYGKIVGDLISKVINSSKFTSTFECPSCGRIGMAYPPDRAEWVFYASE